MKAKLLMPVVIIMLGVTALIAGEGREQKRFHRQHGGPGMFGIEMLADELKLTEQQLTQITEQRFARQKDAIQVRSKVQVAELELRNLMQAANPDENQVKGKVEEIGKLKTELRLNRVQGRLAFQKVLTAEQKETLKTLHKQRLQNRREGAERPSLHQRMFRRFQGNNDDFGADDLEFETDEEFGDGMEL